MKQSPQHLPTGIIFGQWSFAAHATAAAVMLAAVMVGGTHPFQSLSVGV
ncbi:hypothetical protein [Methylobacter tundripaludum]|nr:hypothetical protein [Methylobacter tundripaludum]